MDWKQTYRDLDNAALLSLFSVLADRIDRRKQDLNARSGAAVVREREAEGFQAELERGIALQEQGYDVEQVLDQLRQTLQSHADVKPKDERMQRGLLAYLIDLETRRRWIADLELPRRGLLPSLDELIRNPPTTLPVTLTN